MLRLYIQIVPLWITSRKGQEKLIREIGLMFGLENHIKKCNHETPFWSMVQKLITIPREPTTLTWRNGDALPLQKTQLPSYHAWAYNKHVKVWNFQAGDLFLIIADILKPTGKLEPNQEGPYKITRANNNGSYELEDEDGKTPKRNWNAQNLQKFYH